MRVRGDLADSYKAELNPARLGCTGEHLQPCSTQQGAAWWLPIHNDNGSLLFRPQSLFVHPPRPFPPPAKPLLPQNSQSHLLLHFLISLSQLPRRRRPPHLRIWYAPFQRWICRRARSKMQTELWTRAVEARGRPSTMATGL
jgi:hypothetical protein